MVEPTFGDIFVTLGVAPTRVVGVGADGVALPSQAHVKIANATAEARVRVVTLSPLNSRSEKRSQKHELNGKHLQLTASETILRRSPDCSRSGGMATRRLWRG
jgi:hypothetical protein